MENHVLFLFYFNFKFLKKYDIISTIKFILNIKKIIKCKFFFSGTLFELYYLHVLFIKLWKDHDQLVNIIFEKYKFVSSRSIMHPLRKYKDRFTHVKLLV